MRKIPSMTMMVDVVFSIYVLYSRYSQRYSHFQGENVPSSVFSIFSEKPHAVRVRVPP